MDSLNVRIAQWQLHGMSMRVPSSGEGELMAPVTGNVRIHSFRIQSVKCLKERSRLFRKSLHVINGSLKYLTKINLHLIQWVFCPP